MTTAPADPPRRKLTGAIAPALAVAALAGLGAIAVVSWQGRAQLSSAAPAPAGCILENADALGGPIALLDANGAAVTEANFAGAPAVVFFGYTHCPDVCPTTMYVLAEALAASGRDDVRPVLISVDPARDTPDVLRAYVASAGFPPGLAGLTGSPEQVRAAARAFQASVAAAGAPAASGAYDINHSTFLYVLDESWTTVAAMPTFRAGEVQPDGRISPIPVSPEELSACIAAGLNRR